MMRMRRLEGLAALLTALLVYAPFGKGWGVFLIAFLLPDLSMFAYLAGPRISAAVYNSAHTYVGALVCCMAGVLLPAPGLTAVGLIWCAHSALDRALGYGLKYPEGFAHTHLGRIGRARATVSPLQGSIDAARGGGLLQQRYMRRSHSPTCNWEAG
jgi:hypothetical protein